MLDPAATLALAERVADAGKRLGVESALIGAAALAVHRYTRGTEDVDLAVVVDPHTLLVALQQTLDATGLNTELRLPDDDDPLGGVLVVWGSKDDQGGIVDLVEVVNFRNPGRSTLTPAPAAIARAQPLPGSSLRCVTLEDLIAFKLYAGGLSDLADIEQLLTHNPDADFSAIRRIAAPFDAGSHLDTLLDRAAKAKRR
jgi:hypothetical protein